MEVTLSKKDMDELSRSVAKLLEVRIQELAMANEGYDVLKGRAKSYVDLMITSQNFKFEAHDAFVKYLKESKAVEEALATAIREVIGDEEAIRKMCQEKLATTCENAMKRYVSLLKGEYGDLEH
jgi:MarR-like DNA-binding transcriptional regulator SgrR of sgrS sRNA